MLNGQQPPAKWVSTSAAAAALGVSERAVQKWCSVGKLAARRVPGTRGEKWEIEADSVEKQARTTANSDGEQDERKPESFGEQPEQKRANKPNHAQNKPEREGEPAEREGERETEQAEPFGLEQLRADIERERQERQRDREEIQFLRGVVESDRRDMAELRAALRKALDNAPKQLTIGAADSAPRAANRADEPTHAPRADASQNGPDSGAATSYAAIADWLEEQGI